MLTNLKLAQAITVNLFRSSHAEICIIKSTTQ